MGGEHTAVHFCPPVRYCPCGLPADDRRGIHVRFLKFLRRQWDYGILVAIFILVMMDVFVWGFGYP